MSGKIFLWLLATLSLTTVSHAHAQQPKKVFHIGFLSSGASSASENIEVIRQRLRELGYVEGKNIAFEYRAGRKEKLIDCPTSPLSWSGSRLMLLSH